MGGLVDGKTEHVVLPRPFRGQVGQPGGSDMIAYRDARHTTTQRG